MIEASELNMIRRWTEGSELSCQMFSHEEQNKSLGKKNWNQEDLSDPSK